MKELTQEHIFSIAFRNSLDREQQLISKYQKYLNETKNEDVKNMMKEFEKKSNEHIFLLKDKMLKLNLQG